MVHCTGLGIELCPMNQEKSWDMIQHDMHTVAPNPLHHLYFYVFPVQGRVDNT